MKDARGAIHRQSIWKIPGDGRQNADARKFVSPAGTILGSHRNYQRSTYSPPPENRPTKATTSNREKFPRNKGRPTGREMRVVIPEYKPLEDGEPAQRVPVFGPYEMLGAG